MKNLPKFRKKSYAIMDALKSLDNVGTLRMGTLPHSNMAKVNLIKKFACNVIIGASVVHVHRTHLSSTPKARLCVSQFYYLI